MRLLIETSVIPAWYDRRPEFRKRRRDARRLFAACRSRIHEGFVSGFAMRDLESRHVGLIARSRLSKVDVDPDFILGLFLGYRKETELLFLGDLQLIQLAVYSSSNLDAMVTLHRRQLANQFMLAKVVKVN